MIHGDRLLGCAAPQRSFYRYTTPLCSLLDSARARQVISTRRAAKTEEYPAEFRVGCPSISSSPFFLHTLVVALDAFFSSSGCRPDHVRCQRGYRNQDWRFHPLSEFDLERTQAPVVPLRPHSDRNKTSPHVDCASQVACAPNLTSKVGRSPCTLIGEPRRIGRLVRS